MSGLPNLCREHMLLMKFSVHLRIYDERNVQETWKFDSSINIKNVADESTIFLFIMFKIVKIVKIY